MRWLLKPFLLISVISVLFLSAASGRAGSKNARPHQHQKEADAHTETVHQKEDQIPLSAFEEALNAIEQEAIAAQKQAQSNEETFHSPSVEVNMALVIVGAGYLFVTALQWGVLRQGFLTSHRPHLGIRQIALLTDADEIIAPDSEGRLKANNEISIQLRLINRGGSNAKIIEGNITVMVNELGGIEGILNKSKQPVLPPFDVQKGTPSYSDERNAGKGALVKPAEPYALIKTMPLGTDRDSVRAYLAVHHERNLPSVALHVFGYFKYRVPVWFLRPKRTFFTAFCRRYDAAKGGFVVTNEPDYEYED